MANENDAGIRVVVRVALPDRPGALGHVASRIGALGADIVAVDVLERTSEIAMDEFSVVLPGEDLVALLVREIEEVDGASVDEWRLVDEFPDPRFDALTAVEHMSRASTAPQLATGLASSVRAEFDADWCAIVGAQGVLAATEAGIDLDVAPSDDVAVSMLPASKARIVVSRRGHPFRARERQQLDALARIADRMMELMH